MMRERLTITLRPDILKQVDRVIDGAKIRNRSHAIEFLIQKASQAPIQKALILAGGKGVSLHSGQAEVPKAMLRIGGAPLLEYTIRRCQQHGILDLIVSTGPEGAEIEHYFGDGRAFGVHITYLKQKVQNVGTAPSVYEAQSAIGNEPFLLLYGDVLADIDYSDLIEFHRSSGTLATMALTSAAKTSDWGVVSLHGASIIDFTEKPPIGSTHSYVINAGIYVFQPEIFTHIAAKSKKLEQDVFPRLAKAGQLSGYLFEGRWYDVGTSTLYRQAAKEWQGERPLHA